MLKIYSEWHFQGFGLTNDSFHIIRARERNDMDFSVTFKLFIIASKKKKKKLKHFRGVQVTV